MDDVYVDITISPNEQFTTATNFYGVNGNSRVRLSFRVTCVTNYYGVNCATYCVAMDDDVNGHYSCDTNGGKNCLDGWSGPDCTIGMLAFGNQYNIVE